MYVVHVTIKGPIQPHPKGGAMHGDMMQYERDKVLKQFKKCTFPILIATDVAGMTRNPFITIHALMHIRHTIYTSKSIHSYHHAHVGRGLDIKSIKTVVNYDIARDIDAHTHRVGRTGRAGTSTCAQTLQQP